MFFVIPDLVSAEEVNKIRGLLESANFVSGADSADNAASQVKNNLQVSYNDRSQDDARRMIETAFARSPMFQFLALPKHVAPPTFNKYETGMYYKDHIDHAIIGGADRVRGDMSSTVFLSNADEYAGGELVLHFSGQQMPIKLEAGQAIVYSATMMHRVNEVSQGVRMAAVTSIQSTVKSDEQRDLLGDLTRVMRWAQDNAPNAAENQILVRAYNNLLRMWAEL